MGPSAFLPSPGAQGIEPGQAPGSPGSSPNAAITSYVALAKTSAPLPFAFCRQVAELEGLQGPELSAP